MPPLYTAALFDLDNTLWDRDAAIRATGRQLHETWPAVRAATTADEAEAKFAAFDERGLAGRERLIGRTLEEWPGIGLSHEELAEWYLRTSRSVLPQDPEVFPLLRGLNAAGVPWGIVTNGPTSGQHMTIRSRGLEGLTGCVIVSEEVGCPEAGPRDLPGGARLPGCAGEPQRALRRRRRGRGHGGREGGGALDGVGGERAVMAAGPRTAGPRSRARFRGQATPAGLVRRVRTGLVLLSE